MGVVLYVTIEILRIVAILLQPVMPASMGRLLDLLGRAARANAISATSKCGPRISRSTNRFGGLGPDIGSSPAARCPRLRRSFLATSKRSRRSEGSGRRRMTIIDSHCHLDFPDFADDLDAVVERARAAGVERMITIGTRVRQSSARGRDRGALRRRLLHRRHASP